MVAKQIEVLRTEFERILADAEKNGLKGDIDMTVQIGPCEGREREWLFETRSFCVDREGGVKDQKYAFRKWKDHKCVKEIVGEGKW